MAVRKKFIEQMALNLLRKADLRDPPVDLRIIAARLGVAIERVDHLARGTRAAFDPERSVIEVTQLPRDPYRYSVAHELGHAALEHGGSCSFEGEPSIVDVALDLQEAETGLDHEGEADCFAGRLLVPRAWLRDRLLDHTLGELLEVFEVSKPVLLIAAEDYRLLAKLQP